MKLKIILLFALIFTSILLIFINDDIIKKSDTYSSCTYGKPVKIISNKMSENEVFDNLYEFNEAEIKCFKNTDDFNIINAQIEVDDIDKLDAVISKVTKLANLKSINCIKISKKSGSENAIIDMDINKQQ
jgi:hypothetical protein